MITYDECVGIAKKVFGPLSVPKRLERASQIYDVSRGMGVPVLSRAERERIEEELHHGSGQTKEGEKENGR